MRERAPAALKEWSPRPENDRGAERKLNPARKIAPDPVRCGREHVRHRQEKHRQRERRADPEATRHVLRVPHFPPARSRGRSSTPEPCRRSGNFPDDPARSPGASGRCRSPCFAPPVASRLRGPFHISDKRRAGRSPRPRTSGRNILPLRLTGSSLSPSALRDSNGCLRIVVGAFHFSLEESPVTLAPRARRKARFRRVPGGIRTPNLLIRSQLLYPVELQTQYQRRPPTIAPRRFGVITSTFRNQPRFP